MAPAQTLTSAAFAATPGANRAMKAMFAASRCEDCRREGLPGRCSGPEKSQTRFFMGLFHTQTCCVAFSPPDGLDWTGTTLGLDGTPCRLLPSQNPSAEDQPGGERDE